jgi:nitrate/TMAO reductase-like tetraheme cytochrome c subunit
MMGHVQNTDQQPETGRQRPQRALRRAWLWATAVFAVLVLGAVAFVGIGLYTDRPEFCATCHEMRPYYDAWRQGHHNNMWCVDCHVGQGYPARLAHKFSSFREIAAHFRGDTRFPRSNPAAIADRQCVRCHAQVPSGTASGFNHAAHASRGPCQACHSQAGHDVTNAALTASGEFNPLVKPRLLIGTFAVVDKGSANIPGHVTVSCSRCHNMEQTDCQRCHTPQHKQLRPGACTLCHQPGAAWVFTHPTAAADCAQCHAPSAKHFQPPSGDLEPCTQCHTQAGKSWAFAHPAASTDCARCHAPSAKHFKPATGDLEPCTQCHAQVGKSWSFKHPAASADCIRCHAVPAQHSPSDPAALSPCTRCHSDVGSSWKFSHPSASANCSSCHTPPANHYAGQCSTCHHQPGVTFAFTHPSTGQHSYTSRPCVKCHPNGYTTAYCTCHNRAP